MNASKLLIAKRKTLKLTQNQAAKLSKISRAHYTNIENGLRTPSPRSAQRIATTLHFDWKLF